MTGFGTDDHVQMCLEVKFLKLQTVPNTSRNKKLLIVLYIIQPKMSEFIFFSSQQFPLIEKIPFRKRSTAV